MKIKFIILFFALLFLTACKNKEDNNNNELSADCFSYFTIKEDYNLCFPTENMFCNTKNTFEDESLICKNKFKGFITDKVKNNNSYINKNFKDIIKKHNLSENAKNNVRNSIFKKLDEHYKELNDFESSLLQLEILFNKYNVNCHKDKNIHRCGDYKNSINKFYVDYINKTYFLKKKTDLILEETTSILNRSQ
tara:strand:- start:262 stop:840 length:579 start_codon:yes stop_codon:yes gene_type:complete